MAIKTFKMGPGTFKLGALGAQDASCQVTSLRVECSENVQTVEAIPVLCGEELPREDTVSHEWKLAGAVLQDIDAADLVAYTWTNAGVEVPFEFVPSTAEGREVTGTTRIVPLALGGDASTRPSADIDWAIIGTPALGDTA